MSGIAGTLQWQFADTYEDGTTIPAADPVVAVGIVFDGTPAVNVPLAVATGANSYDMNQLAAYQAFKAGSTHTVALDVVTKAGETSLLSSAATFQKANRVLAPTSVAVV